MFKATAIALMLPCAAIAQAPCLPHDEMVIALAEGYQEARQVIALERSGAVVELFAAESGSWTMTITAPGGLTCLVAAGMEWQALSEELPAPGEDM
jgi:hypothetical protein